MVGLVTKTIRAWQWHTDVDKDITYYYFSMNEAAMLTAMMTQQKLITFIEFINIHEYEGF